MKREITMTCWRNERTKQKLTFHIFSLLPCSLTGSGSYFLCRHMAVEMNSELVASPDRFVRSAEVTNWNSKLQADDDESKERTSSRDEIPRD
jgi:hypothetical protein